MASKFIGELKGSAGSLGGTAGNSILHGEIHGSRHHLDFKEVRTANGTDWMNTTYKLQMRVDSTNHQSIDFVSDANALEHIDILTGNQVFNTRFTSNGLVGIGKTSPAYKLDVAGDISSSSSVRTKNKGINVLTIDTSVTPGNFLIQTNIPYSSGHHMPTIRIEGFPYGLAKTAHIDIVWYIYNGNFTSYSASSSGGWAPTVSLANNGGFVCIHLAGGVYYPKMVVSVESGVGMMSLGDSMLDGWSWSDTACPTTNKVTVGYYSDFGGVVVSGGSLTASGDVTAYSDARLKTDVEKITDATAKVEALNGVTFTRTTDDKRSTGLIAQEVLAVLPEAVNEDDEGFYSVKYGNIVGLLVEAIKEQNARIQELENKLNGK